MTIFDINRKNLYEDLLGVGYFKDEDGTINFPYEDFNDSMSDSEVVRTLYGNLLSDGFYQDEQGNPTISEEEFVSNLCDTRAKLDAYPLTENQRGLYIDWELNRDTTQYNIPSVNRLKGVSASQLKDALVTVVNAHPYLKTRLAERDGDIVQLRLDDEEVVVECQTLTEKPDSRFFQQRVKPFDLFNDRLYRFEIYTYQDTVYLFQDIHHIIFDGGSSIVFTQDVVKALQGEDILTESYSAFDRAQEEYELERSDAYTTAEAYFDGLMGDYEIASYPHSVHPDTTEPSAQVTRLTIKGDDITAFCKKNGFTVNSFFMAAFSEVLQRVLREKHLYYTSITSGRVTTDMQGIMGMFVKTLPVVTCAGMDDGVREGQMTVAETVTAMQKQYVDTQDNAIFPYTRLVEKTGARSEILFVYQGGISDAIEESTSEQSIGEEEDLHLSLDTVKVPISIVVQPEGKDYRVEAEYDGALYNSHDMQLLLSMIRGYAEQACMDRKKTISQIPLVRDEEASQLIALSTGEKLEYDASETFVDMFREQARQQPDALAVKDMKSSLTYGELDSVSDRVACWLVGKGVQPNDFVAIKTHRVKEFAVAMLGIQKASAAYVPVDPEYPQDRIDYMIEDCGAKVVLTEETIAKALEEMPVAKPLKGPSSEVLAYMIYTSGSTGKPKGAMILHRGLRLFIAWNIKEFDLRPGKKNVNHPSFSFDASVFDLIIPLAAGAEVHIFDEVIRKDMDGIARYIVDNHITGMTISTAFGMTLLNQFDLPMEYILLGGEKLMPVKKTAVRLYNGYGPTEFTVCSSFHLVNQDKDVDIPIGRPVPNSLSVICDKYGNLMPKGVPGELCLIGQQIGKGYWNRPELTAERFTVAPFLTDGRKMYHTGDLAAWNNEDELMYMGRIDTQVKLRGFRIEMGEIENVASLFDGIAAVAAEVKTTAGGMQHLCLYFTANRQINTEELKAFMAQSLTEYMVPTAFMQLEEMPMTPGGKINRKALPMPDVKSDTEYVEPANEQERIVAACFSKVLNCQGKIGAIDNFFSWGGDSIKAIRLVSMLRQEGINLQVAQVMKLKTVRNIAAEATGGAQNIQISQDAWSGVVEPTPAIVRYFFDLQMPEAHHFNQANMYKMDNRLSKEQLLQVLDALVRHHDMLRAYVDENSLCVASELKAVDFVEEHDLSVYAGEQLEEAFGSIGTKAQSSFNLAHGPLIKALVLHTQNGNYLNLIIHHLVVDGVSWRIISEDLNTAASQLLEGKDIVLPEKTHSYFDYAKALERYASSYALHLEKPYWEDVRKKLAQYDTCEARSYDRHFGLVRAKLDKDHTSQLLTQCSTAYNTEVNDLLLAALGRAYHAFTGKKGMTIQLEGHGRENFDDRLLIDRTVGWFTSAYPVVLEKLDGDLRQSIRETKEALHRIPNKGLGYGQLFGIDTERVPQFAFNYLGEFAERGVTMALPLIPGNMPKGTSISASNTFGPDFTINGAVTDGQLGFAMMYNEALMGADEAQRMLDAFFEQLKEIVAHTSSLKDTEITASDLGETQWTDDEFTTVIQEFQARGEQLQRIYPLTSMQEGMLLQHLQEPKAWAYRLVSIYEMDALPTEQQLRHVLDRLGRKHEVLRTAIIYEGVSAYRQAIVDRPLGLSMVDLSAADSPEQAVMALREDLLTNGYDLQRKPLFQLVCAKKSADACYLVIAVHHIIVDGWCIQLYMNDLVRYLEEETSGRITAAEENTDGCYEAAVRELVAKDKPAALDYWRKLLDGYETRAEIPSWGDVPADEQAATDAAIINIGAECTERLVKLCQEEQSTINTAAELVWGLVLQTYSRTNDAVFLKVVSGRDNTMTDVNNVVGLFINSVPVRMTTGKETTGREMIRLLQKQAAESNAYDFCALSDIQQQTELGSNFYQTIFAFENYSSGSDDSDSETALPIRPLVIREESFNDIAPSAFVDGSGCLCLKIVFNRQHFRMVEIERILQLFKTLATGLVNTPDQPLTTLPLVTETQQQALVGLGTGKQVELDFTMTFAKAFEKCARQYPDRTAVVDSEGGMTYGELSRDANVLAHRLIDEGVKTGEFVAVMLERTRLFPVTVLAVHKAGAAYMPMDLEYPGERLSYMLENSQARIIVTTRDILKKKQQEDDFDLGDVKIVYVDTEIENADESAVDLSTPDGLAYMIYTSGSTGKPKGTMLHQAGLWNEINYVIDMEQLTGSDHIALHYSFSFDAHIVDFYPILTIGGELHIIPSDIRKDLPALRQYLFDHQITGLGFTTSIACMMLSSYDDLPVRFVTSGGEKLDGVYSDHVQIYNCYGPTECTCSASHYRIEPGQRVTKIPIGRPINNGYLFMLDDYGRLLPQGLMGELCISGVQVGWGYWQLPDRTKEVFGDCPFVATDPRGRQMRIYHTGDICRWNEDGFVDYLGRKDFQVKLRGFRIELGEIENKALNIEGIEQAVALVKKAGDTDHLVLYYILKDGCTLTDEQIGGELKASSLPEYMVPDVYMPMEAMPLTPNGKIDRKKLPVPQVKATAEYVEPEGELETMIADIFKDVLKVDRVGANDNFFEIGGTSINAIRVIVEVSKRGVHLVFNDLFNQKTPRALATLVKEAEEGAGQLSSTETEESKSISMQPAMTAGHLDDVSPATGHPYKDYELLLAKNNLDSFRQGKRCPLGDVMLTGATGYLGMHILKELLTSGSGKIFCPIRCGKDENPMKRLKTLFFYYFDDVDFDALDNRVETFSAEVTDAKGLDGFDKQGLTVINCVANVKHFSEGNDIEMVNIESVRNLIAFCLRTGSRLIHVSTTSISGYSVDGFPAADVKLTEQSLWLGQNITENKYVFSKFTAEDLVLDAILNKHLEAKIMRVGNLSARQSDGEFQINFNSNNFMAMLRAYIILGEVSYDALDTMVEFSPIDEVAKAILLLSEAPRDCIIFHPYNIHSHFFFDILQGIEKAGYPMKLVEMDEFMQKLNMAAENPDLVMLLRPLMAYETNNGHIMHGIGAENRYTTQVLYRLGFRWPMTARGYVARFIRAIGTLGYFDV